MKLEYIIKNLIQNNKIKTQLELTNILYKKGFSTTQSNISRILKKLNTVKILDENKETYYVIHNKPLELTNWIKNLILSIDVNGDNIIIKTYNNAAQLINQILNERSINNLEATIANNNIIIVIPENVSKINELADNLKVLFYYIDVKQIL